MIWEEAVERSRGALLLLLLLVLLLLDDWVGRKESV